MYARFAPVFAGIKYTCKHSRIQTRAARLETRLARLETSVLRVRIIAWSGAYLCVVCFTKSRLEVSWGKGQLSLGGFTAWLSFGGLGKGAVGAFVRGVVYPDVGSTWGSIHGL